jgi:hypothetical protein
MEILNQNASFKIVNFGNATYFVVDADDNTALFAGTLRRATNFFNRATQMAGL